MGEVGQAVHLQFDGNGHLSLDFLGGPARPLRDHVHVIVGDVRVGFHRQPVKRNDSQMSSATPMLRTRNFSRSAKSTR